jgi:ribose transport system permease protein
MEKLQKSKIGRNPLVSGAEKFFRSNIGLIAGLAALCIIVSFRSEYFLTSQNLMNVLRQISTNLFVASAMTMILITGGIDLACGSIISLSGVLTAGAMARMGLPPFLALLIGLAVGAFAGFVNGFILSRTALPPFIITYAVGSVCKGFSYIYSESANIRIEDPFFRWLGIGNFLSIPIPVLFLFVVLVIVWIILNKTKMGRNMYAVGGNIHAAQYSGINIKRIKMFMYIFSGIMAAVAGIILSARTFSARSPTGNGAEMDAIAAAVLGGTSMLGGAGRLSGTIFGAVIIGVLNNGLNLMGMDSYWQYVAKGLVIMVAVYFDFYKGNFSQRKKKLTI